MKRFLSGLMLFIPFFISAGSMETSKENLESRNCEIREEVSDFLNEILVLSLEQNVCEADQIFVPIPNSSEVYHVSSPEECLKRISNSSDPLGMRLVALAKKKSKPNYKPDKNGPFIKSRSRGGCGLTCLALMPLKDPSDTSEALKSIESFSVDEIHSMVKNQIKGFGYNVGVYDNLSLDQLSNYSISCYQQMFLALRDAQKESREIWDIALGRAIDATIETGIRALIITRQPTTALAVGVSAGVAKLCMSYGHNGLEIKKHLELSERWAKAGDLCKKELAKRMGQR